ncbi:hypothetical protein, partial [Lonsdalea quercina]|uniref:hypothetical protein n=1 Tax=Lonsdalea quercina TaxID=71657 RepID=UPI003974877B
ACTCVTLRVEPLMGDGEENSKRLRRNKSNGARAAVVLPDCKSQLMPPAGSGGIGVMKALFRLLTLL